MRKHHIYHNQQICISIYYRCIRTCHRAVDTKAVFTRQSGWLERLRRGPYECIQCKGACEWRAQQRYRHRPRYRVKISQRSVCAYFMDNSYKLVMIIASVVVYLFATSKVLFNATYMAGRGRKVNLICVRRR